DISFWLDAPIELGMTRARERGALDRFEQEKVSFFEKVRSGFAELHRNEPNRMKRLDATQSPEQVFVDALTELKDLS
ncbi:MAG: dTMP kinase, partial [Candidatus Acinetobacter avistercoris]|nr:dTMP kinase [Candidatus Acinetobacter avistercoris]